MINKGNLYLAAGAAVLLSLAAAGISYAHSTSARDFITNASIANEFEIESSKLALEKSQNSEVKSFAQRMVDDHTRTAEQMNEALQSSHSGATPAKELDDKHQKLMDKLEAANGDNFNQQYIGMQTDAHKEAISLFDSYSKHGKNEALRDFAAQTLPALKEHLKYVQQIKIN